MFKHTAEYKFNLMMSSTFTAKYRTRCDFFAYQGEPFRKKFSKTDFKRGTNKNSWKLYYNLLKNCPTAFRI